MNILFLIGKYPNIGGVETVTTVLANSFISNNHEVSIASFERSDEIIDLNLSKDVHLLSLKYPVNSNINLRQLKSFIADNKINVIINQWCIPYKVTYLCKNAIKGTECKLIAVHHNLPNKNSKIIDAEHELQNSTSTAKKIICLFKLKSIVALSALNLKWVYKHSNHFVVLSKSFEKTFLSFTNITSKKKLSTISNPITINEPYKIGDKTKTVIYVGRVDYNQKRVHRIVELWEDIYPKYPDWNLQIIGDGPEKETLEEYAKNKSIKNISFEGFKTPISYYKKASILLLTSEYEGFGLVITEGMNFGVVPIVYGSYSAVYDIISENVNGFIVPPPYNKVKMRKVLQELMDNDNLRYSLSREAIKNAQNFSLDTITNKWEELFDNLIKNN